MDTFTWKVYKFCERSLWKSIRIFEKRGLASEKHALKARVFLCVNPRVHVDSSRILRFSTHKKTSEKELDKKLILQQRPNWLFLLSFFLLAFLKLDKTHERIPLPSPRIYSCLPFSLVFLSTFPFGVPHEQVYQYLHTLFFKQHSSKHWGGELACSSSSSWSSSTSSS